MGVEGSFQGLPGRVSGGSAWVFVRCKADLRADKPCWTAVPSGFRYALGSFGVCVVARPCMGRGIGGRRRRPTAGRVLSRAALRLSYELVFVCMKRCLRCGEE